MRVKYRRAAATAQGLEEWQPYTADAKVEMDAARRRRADLIDDARNDVVGQC